MHTENSLIASSVLPFCHFTMVTLASLLIPKQDRQYPCALRFPSTWNNSASEYMVSSISSLNSLHTQYFLNEAHLYHCIYYFNLLSYLHSPNCPFCFFLLSPPAAAAAKSLQSCPTLCDPIDGSPLGSPIPGILQARTLEWVAISLSSIL